MCFHFYILFNLGIARQFYSLLKISMYGKSRTVVFLIWAIVPCGTFEFDASSSEKLILASLCYGNCCQLQDSKVC